MADALAERTSKTPLIAVAQPLKVWDKKGLAECRIIATLKGSFADRARTFRVRFGKVHGGVWPRKGVVAVFFLRLPVGKRTAPISRKTVFELLSDKEGLATPSEDVIAVVQLAVAGKYVRTVDRERVYLRLPAPGTLLGKVIDADYVTMGTIEEVRLSRKPEVAAQLDYRIETVFKGDLRPGRVFVNVPRVPAKALDPRHKPVNPRMGPAVLMFVQKGDTYALISPYRGCIGIKDRSGIAARAKELAEKVLAEKELRRKGLIGNPAGRATIKQTLQLWWRSWNAKEVENVISCYSRRSKWRLEWDSGRDGKKRISKVIRDYPETAKIYVIHRRAALRKDGRAALVTVTIRVDAEDGPPEFRPAVMTFVRENGMWLILHEGN